MKKLRRWWLWLLALLVIIGGILAFQRIRTNLGSESTQNEQERVTAFLGNLITTSSGSGEVVAVRDANLSMGASGTVTEVTVAVGDTVKAGDVLVQLDATSALLDIAQAEIQVAEAEHNVEVSRINLTSSETSLEDNLDNTYSSLTTAQTDLIEAQNAAAHPDEQDEILQQRINVDRTWRALRNLEDEYYSLVEDQNNCEGSACEPITNRIVDVAASIASAREDYSLAVNQYDQAVENLENAVENAEDRIDNLQYNISETQDEFEAENGSIRSSERNLETSDLALQRALISLEQAQNSLARLTLVAPFGGMITAVHVDEGEMASGVVVTLMSTEAYEVVLDIDEIDIGTLNIGQPVSITLESWPTQTFSTSVHSIAPVASTQGTDGSVVSYEVRLVLPETALPVRVGMTANATIITRELADIVLVSNRAIFTDRSNGTYSVYLVDGDKVEEVQVEIGARDGQNTQILSGIEAGDVLQIGNASAEFGSGFGPGDPSDGGFGPPDGGGSPFGG